MERFKQKSDEELVKNFNKEVGICAPVTARFAYLFAIRDELEGRGIDCSIIGDKRSVCSVNRVRLGGKKLVLEEGGKK